MPPAACAEQGAGCFHPKYTQTASFQLEPRLSLPLEGKSLPQSTAPWDLAQQLLPGEGMGRVTVPGRRLRKQAAKTQQHPRKQQRGMLTPSVLG